MIAEDYCSYEVAKLLKEKGFNESCYTYYDDIDNSINRFDKGLRFNNTSYPWGVPYDISKAKKYIVTPTHQMAMKWLREEKNIFIVIEPHAYDYVNEKNKSYVCSLWVGDNYYEYLESRDYPSYEKTVETALKYCLEHLI